MLMLAGLVEISSAQTPAPSNLVAVEQIGQSNLGSVLTWSPVGTDTYNIYADRGSYDCGGRLIWTQIATGVTGTTYTDEPSNPPLPVGAGECYAVTAVDPVTGESPKSNTADDFIGDKLYFTANYDSANCSMKGASLTVTQVQNGVSTVVINLPNHASGAFGGHVRLYDNATYSAQLILPDGTVVNFPALFASGQQLSAIESSFNNPQFHCGSGSSDPTNDQLRHYVVQTTLEATVP
jgi:hypothetical protein